jgi:uncharacterized membrane protein
MAEEAPASPLGPSPRVAAAIAYAGWWASGALVWLVERDRPAVRFHAMQSMIAFGIVFAAWITFWIGSFLMLVSSASGFFVLQRISQLILLAGFLVWAICLIQTIRGVEVRLPVVGDWAERLTSRATSLRSNPPARG